MTLTCGEARLMASDLLDERLNERERSDLLDHIRTCTSCPQLYRSMAAIHQHLRTTALEAPPDELRKRIRRLFGDLA
jgi:predicted anti-sigma-YlaC factor YlaD